MATKLESRVLVGGQKATCLSFSGGDVSGETANPSFTFGSWLQNKSAPNHHHHHLHLFSSWHNLFLAISPVSWKPATMDDNHMPVRPHADAISSTASQDRCDITSIHQQRLWIDKWRKGKVWLLDWDHTLSLGLPPHSLQDETMQLHWGEMLHHSRITTVIPDVTCRSGERPQLPVFKALLIPDLLAYAWNSCPWNSPSKPVCCADGEGEDNRLPLHFYFCYHHLCSSPPRSPTALPRPSILKRKDGEHIYSPNSSLWTISTDSSRTLQVAFFQAFSAGSVLPQTWKIKGTGSAWNSRNMWTFLFRSAACPKKAKAEASRMLTSGFNQSNFQFWPHQLKWVLRNTRAISDIFEAGLWRGSVPF